MDLHSEIDSAILIIICRKQYAMVCCIFGKGKVTTMDTALHHLLFGYLNGSAYLMTGSITLAWVVLSHGIVWKREQILRNLAELVVLFYLLWWAFSVPILLLREYNSVMWISFHALIALVYVQCFADCPKQTRIFLWCSLYAGICCLSTIGGQVQYLIAYTNPDAVEMSFTVSKLFYLLMIPLAMYLRHFNFGRFRTVPKAGYVLVVACALSIFALTAVELPWMKTDYRIVITLLTGVVCVFAIMLVGIFVIYTLCKEQAERLSEHLERQRLQGAHEMTEAVEANLEDLRCIRHDLKNQYGYIRMLLQSNQKEEALAYLEQMSENMPEQLSYVDCGNRSMNTILNMEFSKAKRAGVNVSHQLVVPPVLPFADSDLCSVLGNLMDNAIEECTRRKEQEGQFGKVRLEIYPHKSYLFIMCSNGTDRENLERYKRGLKTTKADDGLHGYGTHIVAKVAEKYNGWVEYSLEDGSFVAKVILDMKTGEGAK